MTDPPNPVAYGLRDRYTLQRGLGRGVAVPLRGHPRFQRLVAGE
jgi:hypothetical protein